MALKPTLIGEGFNCTDDNEVGCLWVRIRGKSKADIPGGVSYRLPRQYKGTDEVCYKRVAGVSQSLAFVPVGDFNLWDVCWKLNTVKKRQSRRFLECVEHNFLTQLEVSLQRTVTHQTGCLQTAKGWRELWESGDVLGTLTINYAAFNSLRSKEGGSTKPLP